MNIAPQRLILLTRAQSEKKRACRHNFFFHGVLTELLVKAWYNSNTYTKNRVLNTK
jgi:hypothetical protein